jgi:tetratricopeptide (TPR) repeat protein
MGWTERAGQAGIDDLVARERYAEAIDALRGQLAKRRDDPQLRAQLADVLALSGRAAEASQLLVSLADELAQSGQTARAIAAAKKAQALDPAAAGTEDRVARRLHETPTSGMRVRVAAPSPFGADDAVRDELVALIEEAFAPAPAPEAPAPQAAADAPPVVDSPLFSDFSPAELLAVIQGLRLLSFASGSIVVTEGQAGDSLFVLTLGRCRAFVKSPAGRSLPVRELQEGDFFGEISVLTGQPRTATIVTATRCEMLELDREALDSIAQTHFRVREVLQRFAEERHGSTVEAAIRRMGTPRS